MSFFHLNEEKFGFGCMRLPMIEGEVDIEQFKKMVDYFIEKGFIYFDTAHGYINGKSETAIKEALTKRYSRDRYTLTDKLTDNFFKKEEDIIPFFNHQLECCGVTYFDFYLMHAQNRNNYEQYKRCNAYQVCNELKKQGKIKVLGISFHDTHDILDKILTEQPVIDCVQIQYNYLDLDDERIESRLCLEVCKKHNKPVIIMEPIKGGNLINLPPLAKDMLKQNNLTPQNLALRFAASPDNVFMVLSGMSTMEQMVDNVSFMKGFKPLKDNEYDLCNKIAKLIKSEGRIDCTACKYCVDGCPKKIRIPDLFRIYNAKTILGVSNKLEYKDLTVNNGLASSCIKCGKCELKCPQHLPIRDLLIKVSKEYE